MTTTQALTVSDAVDLGTIVGWAIGCKRVVWLDERGDLRYGTVRAVGDDRGNRLNGDEDIRDGFLLQRHRSVHESIIPMGCDSEEGVRTIHESYKIAGRRGIATAREILRTRRTA